MQEEHDSQVDFTGKSLDLVYHLSLTFVFFWNFTLPFFFIFLFMKLSTIKTVYDVTVVLHFVIIIALI